MLKGRAWVIYNYYGWNKKKKYYNDLPLYYCNNCKSISIIAGKELPDYCNDCGSTDIKTTQINKWLKERKEYKLNKELHESDY